MKKIIACCLFIVVITQYFRSNAQELTIGEKCPDVELTHIINYPVTKIKLSHYSGKLVILDFWGTGCAGCLADFKPFNELQHKFGNKIQIIMVNKESEDSTRHFFSLHPQIKLPDALPFVTGDTILSSFFPHQLVPHDVWIDSSGIIRFITDGYNTTSKHIQEFLEGEVLHLKEKNDNYHYVWYKPLIATVDSAALSKIYYYSYLMPSIDGYSLVVSRERINGSKMINRIRLNMASLLRLYSVAYGEEGKYDFSSRNSIILEVPDTSIFVYPKDNNLRDEFMENHSYAYDLQVPPSLANQLYKFMQQDLVRYFGYVGKVEKRKVRCLVLLRTGKEDKLRSEGGIPRTNLFSNTQDSVRYFINKPFSGFTSWLNYVFKAYVIPTPFIDATGYEGKVDIWISTSAINNVTNIPMLNKTLKRYGLILVEKDWPTNALIIRKVHS